MVDGSIWAVVVTVNLSVVPSSLESKCWIYNRCYSVISLTEKVGAISKEASPNKSLRSLLILA